MVPTQLRKSFFVCLVPRSSGACFLLDSQVPHPLRFLSTVVDHPPSKNSDSIAVFLKENGLSDAQLDKVLEKRQQLRFADLEKSVKPKINIFKEFGFSKSEIAEIVSRQPTVLCCNATKRLYPALSLLRDLYSSNHEVALVFGRIWGYFTSDLEKTLRPNIEFLNSSGVPMERILRVLRFFPTALCIKPEILRTRVEKLQAFGMDFSSKMFIYALGSIAPLKTQVWELKFQTLKDLGFTESDTLDIFRKEPLVFRVSPEKIKRVAEAILATNRYTLSSIKVSPVCFHRSLEKRIKPRLQVLEILEKRKLIKKWPRLAIICLYTDEEFRENFIAPYPDDVFPRFGFPLRKGVGVGAGVLLDAK